MSNGINQCQNGSSNKPPYSISRAISIDLGFCHLPAANVLSAKADKFIMHPIPEKFFVCFFVTR